MNLGKKRSRFDEVPASSLSDIAFLLIVFFMVSSVFLVREGLSLNLPASQEPVQVPRQDLVVLALAADGSLTLNGSPLARTELPARLSGLAASGKRFSVEVHPDCEYRHALWCIGSLQEAGIDRMSVRSQEAP